MIYLIIGSFLLNIILFICLFFVWLNAIVFDSVTDLMIEEIDKNIEECKEIIEKEEKAEGGIYSW